MDNGRGDNRRASSGYDERERERRARAAAQRKAERDRFEQRQRTRYQPRRPQQGTWYEQPQRQRPRQQQARRSVPLQHQQLNGGGYLQQPRQQRQQRQQQQRPAQMSRTQMSRGAYGAYGAYGGYGRAPALEPRDLAIRTAIVAVLLVVLIARIVTFGGCAQSSELDAQIADQQTQLQQIADGNAQTQSQLDSMQSAIDSYNQLVSSSSSSDPSD